MMRDCLAVVITYPVDGWDSKRRNARTQRTRPPADKTKRLLTPLSFPTWVVPENQPVPNYYCSVEVLDFTALRPYAVVTFATTTEGPVKFTNVRELKTKTSEMLRTVERGNTVLVTTHGRPTAMLVPVTEDDIEDVLLAYSPKLRKKIEEGLKDIRAGRTMPLSSYKAKRGKKKARTA